MNSAGYHTALGCAENVSASLESNFWQALPSEEVSQTSLNPKAANLSSLRRTEMFRPIYLAYRLFCISLCVE